MVLSGLEFLIVLVVLVVLLLGALWWVVRSAVRAGLRAEKNPPRGSSVRDG